MRVLVASSTSLLTVSNLILPSHLRIIAAYPSAVFSIYLGKLMYWNDYIATKLYRRCLELPD